MLKFTQPVIGSLVNFHRFHQQYGLSMLKGASSMDKLRATKAAWLSGEGSQLTRLFYKHLIKDSIDGSAGGSGFIPPEDISKALSEVREEDLVDYASCEFSPEEIKDLEKYCIEEDIIPQNFKLGHDANAPDNPSKTLYAIPSFGTHPLFHLTMQTLIKTKGDRVIVPTPTYGLLLEPIISAGGQILALPLSKDNDYKVNSKQLKRLIAQEKKIIKKSYSSDLSALASIAPHLAKDIKSVLTELSQSTKGANQLVRLLNIKTKQTQAYKALSPNFKESLLIPQCPTIRAFFNINPHTPTGKILKDSDIEVLAEVLQKRHIKIIDDISHRNLYFTKFKPGTFAKSKAADQTVTLLSFSKDFGIAAVRAGIILGNKKFIKKLGHKIFESLNTVGIYTQVAISAILNMPKKSRDSYLEEVRDEYLARRNFVHAAICGIDNVSDPKMKEQVQSYVKGIVIGKKPMAKKFQALLLEGIEGVSLTTLPEGTQFVLLDFSKSKGKYLGNVKLESSLDFRNAFYCLSDLNTIPGELNHCFDFPNLRLSISLDPEQISESLLRIKAIIGLLTDKPSLDKEVQSQPKKFGKKEEHLEAHEAIVHHFKRQLHQEPIATLNEEKPKRKSTKPIRYKQ